jgi:hypothetical protein
MKGASTIEHGLGVQEMLSPWYVPPAEAHWVAVVEVQVPSVRQQAPVGTMQGFGVHTVPSPP